MKRFTLFLVVLLWAVSAHAQQTCIDSSGYHTSPLCDSDDALKISSSHSKCVEVTPTIETGAYATGDLISAVITLDVARVAGKGFTVETISLADEGAEDATVEFILFDADPDSGDAWTINSAVTVGDAFLDDICCHVQIAGGYAFADNGVTVESVSSGCTCVPDSGTSIYAVLIAGGAETFDATDALTLKVCGKQD